MKFAEPMSDDEMNASFLKSKESFRINLDAANAWELDSRLRACDGLS
jgi:hypothetical protein